MPSDITRLTRRRLVTRIACAVPLAGILPASLAGTVRSVSAQDAEPLQVVATFSILADWVHRVGSDRIELAVIVPAGGDTHTFDPNPEQVASIAEADVIVEIGAGFETWLDDMVESSGSDAERIVVSDGIDLLSLEGSHDDAEDHSHDPHIWGDVANAIRAVETINQHLDAIDPDRAASYDANAAAYIAELQDLDAWIRTQVETIPEDQRKLVTTHDTFGYYAHAYGFTIVGTALNSLSTEGGDPPASDIASLVEEIQSQNVPAIFAENISNNDLMEVIASEAGVTLAPPLYSDALGEPDSDGANYVDMMTYNTSTIVTALHPG